jgi:hypothetical protein
MPNVNLKLDAGVHAELWSAKERLREKEGRTVLPWEEFVVRAVRAFAAEPKNGRRKK